ncbi:hypothetical protein QN362_00335 [Actimicrobium sp. CCC2.4]|uniref:DUF6950 family protein n=1 Tax=Actimicrobium sp. CCC2.4 TaxID=3048606 RepID=UPI002AC8BF38|nr:hypothetical protein [Actimicrobium sp. CCC2.4]MEB0133772.1 hypothetical protein [Actimicrobium sp. CCC2.4]WPX31315.1 hypothetical protein RHM62_13815 [Actimicrobium sp. CCC2.4]
MTLPEYIAANLERPFAWGSHDCVLFAIGWVNLATAVDHLDEFDKWTTERQAIRTVKAVGGLQRAYDERFKAVHPNLAQDGAIGLYQRTTGIFSGAHLICPGIQKLEFIDRSLCLLAWHY